MEHKNHNLRDAHDTPEWARNLNRFLLSNHGWIYAWLKKPNYIRCDLHDVTLGSLAVFQIQSITKAAVKLRPRIRWSY